MPQTYEEVKAELTGVANDIKGGLEAAAEREAKLTERLEKLELEGKAPRYSASGGEQKLSGLVQASPRWGEFKSGDTLRMKVDIPSEQSKSLITGTGTPCAIVFPEDDPRIYHPAQRVMTLRDLIPVIPTSSNTVEFSRELSFTNAADEQAAEGEIKPESEMTFELKQVNVATVAHHINVSKQALEDRAGLQAHLDGRMLYGLSLKIEELLLEGSGDIVGFLQDADVPTYNRHQATDTDLDTLARALTQVQIADNMPTAVILNPSNWESIRLAKDDEGRYLWQYPTNEQPPRLHGVSVVVSNSITEGDFLVGDFTNGCQIRDRQQASLEISREHSDNFTRNIVTLLAEVRLALAITRPQAFVKGTLPGDAT